MKKDNMDKHIALRVPKELAERISALCAESGLSTSAFIRMAIADRVRTEEVALARYASGVKL